MLPIPNLDDRYFEQIIEESIKTIPQLSKEWTDLRYHDPGMTFIDLLGWLIEMQQYYLNRIPTKNKLKFLKLLDCLPEKAKQANAVVLFNGYDQPYPIPKGTKMISNTGIVFETEEKCNYNPIDVEKILVSTEMGFTDNTLPNEYDGVFYYAFGVEAKKGNQIYIGMNKPLPQNQEVRLSLKFYDEYPVKMGSFAEEKDFLTPLAKISYKYYGIKDGKNQWIQIDLIKDETIQFLLEGTIVFRIKEEMKEAKIHGAYDKERYWFCFTVEEEGFQVSPRIDGIQFNTVNVVQKDTLSMITEFDSTGEPLQKIEITEYVDIYGYNEVQIAEEEGWSYWRKAKENEVLLPEEKAYQIVRDEEQNKKYIVFGNGRSGSIPAAGEKNIRIISYMPELKELRCIGKSTGVMEESFEIELKDVLWEKFKLQIGRKSRNVEGYIWEDWTLVENFDTSAPWDLHYIYDEENNKIVFGDNENGAVPLACEDKNIFIIGCVLGRGAKGNIKDDSIKKVLIPELKAEIQVYNPYKVVGGKDKETLEEAQKRVPVEIKKICKAVTTEDYESIALNTPGLRISRAKAIPLFQPGMYNYPENKAQGQITVVVLPYSETPRPIPGKKFLENVKRHLDHYRLLCTEVHVIAPQYIKATIMATVVVRSYIAADEKKIFEGLNQFFNEKDGMGWVLGKALSKGDLYEAINEIEGVEYITDLSIQVEGKEVYKKNNGDIQIPPYGLIFPGKHEIETISIEDL